MSDRLEIYALGSLEIRQNGATVTGFASRKVEALLVYLAATQRPQPREFLAELLWEERTQTQSLGNLRQVLFDFRQNLAHHIIVTRQTVALNPAHPTWLDAVELERQLRTASQQWTNPGGLSPTACEGLQQTLDLYQGDFLAGFYVRDCKAFEAWMLQERERLRRQVIEALQQLVDSHLQRGVYTAGIAQATRLLQLEPLLEEAHCQMMTLLVKAGQRSAALSQYETCRRLLADELGIAPTRTTTTLYEEIRAGELTASLVSDMPSPNVIVEKETASTPKNPYKGLRAFQEADAPEFFGREALTERLIKRLAESGEVVRFLAVIGPSGSGKSSVVRAGLIPALRRGSLPNSERWLIVEMFPGAFPVEELEATLLRIAVNPPTSLIQQMREDERGLGRAIKRVLPGDDTELVLIIDQFEEVFTLLGDEAGRAHFLNSLDLAISDPRSRVRVIITLRADFMDRPLCYGRFGELVRQRNEFVLPLSPDELQRAIVGPARRVGLTLDTDLVAAIIREVDEQPGALPLLQYTLAELFDRREGNTLALAAYRETGGVTGAVARRADDLYNALDTTSQPTVRQLFLRLITLGEGVGDARRRVRQTELISIAENPHTLEQVIGLFSKYRLLTLDRDPVTGSPTVEVAHEALIRSWGRLRKWLDESRDNLRVHRRLTAATAEWMNAARDQSYLATGTRLLQFEALAASSDLELNREEREYLLVSVAEREWQEEAERERQVREAALERRSRNFLQGLVAVLVVAVIVGFGLAAIALTQSQIARQNAAIADRNAAESQNVALVTGSQAALANGNTDLAIALGLQAITLDPTSARAQIALGQAAYAPGTVRRFVGHTDQVWGVAFSPEGRRALSGGDDKTLILWDLASGAILRRFTGGHTASHIKVAFSPDGRTILSGADDGVVILWDVEKGRIIHRMEGHIGWLGDVHLSPDGRTALSSGEDKTLILWDVTTGTLIRRLTGHTDVVQNAVFSPDGQTVLSGSEDKLLIVWDVATGTIIRQMNAPDGVFSVAFSPDGRRALVGTAHGNLFEWDVTTGQMIRRFKGNHTSQIFSVAFSPDGKRALTGAYDTWIGLWDMEAGELTTRLRTQSAGAFRVMFSADGRYALSGSSDKTVRLWDLQPGQVLRRFEGHKALVTDVKISPDRNTALSTSEDGTAILWDIRTGQQRQRLTVAPGTGTYGVAYTRDGHTALVSTGVTTTNPGPGDIILWNLDTGEAMRRFSGQHWQVYVLALNPDGRTFASGARDGTVFLWDMATGQIIRRFSGETQSVGSIDFSPDGQTILSGGFWGSLLLWDVQTGKILRRLDSPGGNVRSVMYRRDGRAALSSSNSGTLLWDLSNGAVISRFDGGTVFSPDERLIFGDLGTSLILVDVTTATTIRQYPTGDRRGFRVAFTPDGRSVLVGFGDGGLELWRIDSLDELIAWMHANRYIPELTCEQRQLYRVTPGCDSRGSFPTRTPFPTSSPPAAVAATKALP